MSAGKRFSAIIIALGFSYPMCVYADVNTHPERKETIIPIEEINDLEEEDRNVVDLTLPLVKQHEYPEACLRNFKVRIIWEGERFRVDYIHPRNVVITNEGGELYKGFMRFELFDPGNYPDALGIFDDRIGDRYGTVGHIAERDGKRIAKLYFGLDSRTHLIDKLPIQEAMEIIQAARKAAIEWKKIPRKMRKLKRGVREIDYTYQVSLSYRKKPPPIRVDLYQVPETDVYAVEFWKQKENDECGGVRVRTHYYVYVFLRPDLTPLAITNEVLPLAPADHPCLSCEHRDGRKQE